MSVADADEAERLADLPLEATVALADVAGAIKDGLLAFASATGLVETRSLADLDVAVLMIDGLDVAGSCVVVCLVISCARTERQPLTPPHQVVSFAATLSKASA